MNLEMFGYLLAVDSGRRLAVLILITQNSRKPPNPLSLAFRKKPGLPPKT